MISSSPTSRIFKPKTFSSNKGKETRVLDHVDPIVLLLSLKSRACINLKSYIIYPSVLFLATLGCGVASV
jgi:hypothetical protein